MVPMSRTREELERAAADAEAWLDSLDPETTSAENPTDLRRIGLALRALVEEQREVEEAVAAARVNARSWGEIGLVLGISRQAARERYGEPAVRP
jgi:DNA-directed RNA polymerase specialized sigma24 family protein